MHCDEVIRELAVPTDDRDSAALFEHLATCLSCRGWAQRAGQLDRLWEATRPMEPSADAWDTVWAHVTASLDSAAPAQVLAFSLPNPSSNGSLAKVDRPGLVETHSSARSRRWSWAAVGLIGLAQAAAILLALASTWQHSTGSFQPASANVTISTSLFPEAPGAKKVSGPSSVAIVEIDEGRLVVIHAEGSAPQVVDLTPQAASYKLEKRLRNLESALVDDWLLMLNEVESMTKPLVAMKE